MSNMNPYAIVFAIVFFFLWTTNAGQVTIQPSTITAVRSLCVMKAEVENAFVEKVRAGDFSPDNDQLEKYVYCVYREFRLVNREGNIKKELFLKALPEGSDTNKALDAIEACKSQEGANRHETAYKTLKCYNSKYPKNLKLL